MSYCFQISNTLATFGLSVWVGGWWWWGHPKTLDCPWKGTSLILSCYAQVKEVLDSENVCVKSDDPSVKILGFFTRYKEIDPYVNFFPKVPLKAPDFP